MPFLRPLLESVASILELRSSKTLIGSGAATCDVVIAGENVLELHALLNLTADNTSAKLVPFSTASTGICYVNDNVVPRDGAVVVHGDRVAFGDARNAFLFELTPSPPTASESPIKPQRSDATVNFMQRFNSGVGSVNAAINDVSNSSRAFRKALDVLRGDRKATTPSASVVASIQHNRPKETRTSTSSAAASSSLASSSRSRDQLSQFLLEASTDSLLSDYVERKLRQRQSGRRSHSNSSSRASSTQSQQGRTRNSVRQSTDERNEAEVEKLRLSQRIREVNDVLNGEMDFQASYLSPSSKRRRGSRPLWISENDEEAASRSGRDGISDAVEDEDEDDDDDELPAMMEKPTRFVSESQSADVAVSIQTESSEQEQPPQQEAEVEEATRRRRLLDDSLESMRGSDIDRSQQQPDSHRQSVGDLARANPTRFGSLPRGPITGSNHRGRPHSMRRDNTRTALHQKLIDQTIRRKRHELISQAFVRWNRGLRIQNQRRDWKAQQLRVASLKLGRLRRDHLFFRWREFAEMRSQALGCRLEAFQHRRGSRLVRKIYTALYLNRMTTMQRAKTLRGLLTKKSRMTRLAAFRRWQKLTQTQFNHDRREKLQRQERQTLDVLMDRTARRHHYHTSAQRQLRQVLRCWWTIAGQQRKQRQILRKLLRHGDAKRMQVAVRTWNQACLLHRHHQRVKEQSERQIQQTMARMEAQHNQTHSSLLDEHARQLQELVTLAEKKDQELQQVKRQQQVDKLNSAAIKTQWEQDLPEFFESVIVRCDVQIAETNDQLEFLLQNAEKDVKAARFGAAQFLVNAMLQQKIDSTNERVHLQEAQLALLSSGKVTPCDEDPEKDWSAELSSNAKFLYDMIQQRLTRLQQLHQSMTKLAAVAGANELALDPERLRHGNFVTDAIYQRQKTHLAEMLRLYHELGRSSPPARAAQ